VIESVAEPVEPEVRAREVAAPFLAPVNGAISVATAVVSVPLAAMPVDAAPTRGKGAPAMPPQPAAPLPIRARDLLWLALAFAILIGTGLGIRDPWPADEPRFAALARDMALSQEWLFPRVGGDLYQDKPPLYFWLLAISYLLFGSLKGWFLIPSFLAAGGTLFLIYDFGRRTVSREAGLAAALITVCTVQFLTVARGAQIDATLCFLTTFSLYAFLRHLLFGPAWRWYFLGGFLAGLGVFTKGVGFLPVLLLIPYFALRAFKWKGLPAIDAGAVGWRWWLAPLAMLLAISLWFVPMLLTVAASGSAEYAAYRDEILFKQTVGRYAAAWHHVKGWHYFLVEVIPALWLPWSLLLIWLVPRFKSALHERNARVWLPLSWVVIVLVFFSVSPGKRGIYILPALPALTFAAMPFLESILTRAGIRRAGFVLAGVFMAGAAVLAVGFAVGAEFAEKAANAADFSPVTAIYVYLALCGAGLAYAALRAPLASWPVALGTLAIVFSYLIAPAMNGERSGRDFTASVLAKLNPAEQLALVAYKEQFLLYLDRPTVNFGHRRWQEGPQESYDASVWLNAEPNRVLLLPESTMKKYRCFLVAASQAGRTSREDWFLVRAPAERSCADLGDSSRAIPYAAIVR
ncbi:MAG TPA: glycosyltransferase family 39 protein, partial [Steroidobacteraceae bacterium]|nr:glycosyltransferase family 39 protein [Steroidobacteraceae bacterium]